MKQGSAKSKTNATVLLACALSVAPAASIAAAEVVFDGTTGGTAGPAAMSGNTALVPASAGRQVGRNLFHSFRTFSVPATGAVEFSGPASVQRVLARVTGGTPSQIDGQIRSTIPKADVYLMNPAGIVFGTDSSIDVDGAFVATTASSVRFADGAEFAGRAVSGEVLTTAEVESFGFGADSAASLTVRARRLVGNPGKPITLAGGDVRLEDGRVETDSADLQLMGVRPGGRAFVSGEITGQSTGDGMGGNVLVSGQSQVVVVGNGLLSVSAANLTQNGGDLIAQNTTAEPGRGVTVNVTETARLDGGEISTSSIGSGQAGDATIRADRVEVLGGGFIGANALGSGFGGRVVVRAETVLIDSTGSNQFTGFSTRTFTRDSAPAGGDVIVEAGESVRVTGAGTIDSGSRGAGPAGDVLITAPLVEVLQSGLIGSSTTFAGQGGRVNIDAQRVVLDASGGSSRVAIVAAETSAATPTGNGGGVTLRATEVQILNGAAVSVATGNVADAGDISIEADRLTMRGQGTGLYADTRSGGGFAASGNGGSIRLDAQRVMIEGGAQINSTTRGPGVGGDVIVSAGTLTLDGLARDAFTGIRANTLSKADNAGAGGSVRIEAGGQVRVLSGAGIDARTAGPGKGGSVIVEARSITIDGSRGGGRTGVNVQTDPTIPADGGTASLFARDTLTVTRGLVVSTASGSGGDLTLSAGTIRLLLAGITSRAAVNGGNLTLTSPAVARISQTQFDAKAGDTGGSILMNPQTLVLQNSQLVADADNIQAGNIDVGSDVYIERGSTLSANSLFGRAGVITIESPVTDLSGLISPLSTADPGNVFQLRDSCVYRAIRPTESTFTASGRGVAPLDPAGLTLADPVQKGKQ